MAARATLTDVARGAGVSISTASLAFSGAGPISADTKAKVLASARDLGYAGPNPLARSLRRGRTGVIGIIVGRRLRYGFRDPVLTQTLDGVAACLGEAGFGMLLIPTDEGAGEPADLVRFAAMDAAILLTGSTTASPSIQALKDRAMPTVHLDGASRGSTPIHSDDQAGTRQLAEHLLALGHTRIAVATLPWHLQRRQGPVDLTAARKATMSFTARRIAGIADAGVTPVAVEECSGSLVEEGIRAGHALLSRTPRPTAIMGLSDLLAAGLVLAARERGLTVPGDVSITGYGGVDLPWFNEAQLTTVVQPISEKGRLAAAAAIELARGGKPRPVRLDVEFRPGTTTGPAPQH